MKHKFSLLLTVLMLSMTASLWTKAHAATTISCEQAREYALSVSANNELYNSGAEYTVYGYVTSIQYAWTSSAKNMSFWMADTETGGNVIEAYKCAIENEADVPNVGAYVQVTGTLTKYNTTPEFSAGCSCTIIAATAAPEFLGSKTIAEFLSLKNTKDTCLLTGIASSISNTTYGNFYLVDGSDSVYIYGLLTADKQAQQFASLDIVAGDEVTLKAVYMEYNNNPQAKNAIYVSSKKPYHIYLYAPNACPDMKPAIIGSFNNWEEGLAMNEQLDDYSKTVYYYYLMVAKGTEFKFREVTDTDWSNEIQYKSGSDWLNPGNNVLGSESTLTFDWGDNSQYRFTKCTGETPVSHTLSVAEAIEKGMALENNTYSADVDTVYGYVVNPQQFNLSYMAQIWNMADDAENSLSQNFQAYNCYPLDGDDTVKVLAGDIVMLVGNIYKYVDKSNNVTIEMKNRKAEFIYKVSGDRSVHKDAISVSVSEALSIAGELATGATSDWQYEITGYVSSMAGNPTDYKTFGNQNFWITDNYGSIAASNANGAFYVYQGIAEKAVKVGDRVRITTPLKNYQGLIESNSKLTVTILSEGPAVEPVDPFVLDLTTTSMYIDYWTIENATYNSGSSEGNKNVYDIGSAIASTSYVNVNPNVRFQIANTSGKEQAFVVSPGQYYEFSGKNGVIRVLNTQEGDIIKITAAAKGATACSFVDSEGKFPINATALSADLTLPAKDGDYTWRTLEWQSLGGEVLIKEFAAGWRIESIELKRTAAPTPNDLYNAGYNIYDNVVFCIKFTGDATICNDIYMVGSFSNWEASFNGCPQFIPLSGFDGWYVAEMPYTSGFGAKPVQARSNGSFAWANQCGDPDAWTHIDGETADITYGITDEANIAMASAGAYIYEMSYWKGHTNPCVEETDMNVYVYLIAPQNAPAAGVEIIGDFDNWVGTTMEEVSSGEYAQLITATASQGFKFREVGTWDNEIVYWTGSEWVTLSNIQFSDVWTDGTGSLEGYKVVALDLSNPDQYRWISDISPVCEYQLDMTDTYGDGWNGAVLHVYEGIHHMQYTLSDADGSHKRVHVPYYGGTVNFNWASGSYDSEVGFEILASNGRGLFRHEANTSISDGDLVFTMADSPCLGSANEANPQNIQAQLTEDYRLAITWDAVDGAAYYRIDVLGPDNITITNAERTYAAEHRTSVVKWNGDYTIHIISCDVNGMQMGETYAVVPVTIPQLGEVTVRVLIPTDSEIEIPDGLWLTWNTTTDATLRTQQMTALGGRIFELSFDPEAPAYSYWVHNKQNWQAAGCYRSGAWENLMETSHCAEALYAYGDTIFSLIQVENCLLADHDYRITSASAVASAGRLDLSWVTDSISDGYYIGLYDASNDDHIDDVEVGKVTNYTWGVSDSYDGKEIYAVIYPSSPYWLRGVQTSNVTLEKSAIELKNISLSTEDSITLDLSWTFSTTAPKYMVEIQAYGNSSWYIVKREVVTDTVFHYTAISPRWYMASVQPLDAEGNAIGGVEGGGYIYLGNAPQAITNLQSQVSGRQITFTWESVSPQVYAQIFYDQGNENYEQLYGDLTDQKSLVYTAEKDGMYLLQLRTVIEYAPGLYSYLPDYVHTTAQVFSVPTYHVELTATEGGYIFPEDLSGDYPAGYSLTFTANISSYDYAFDRWSDGVTDASRTIIVQGDISLQAIFRKYVYLTVEPSANGSVNVTNYLSQSENVYTFLGGDEVQLTAVPDVDCQFIEWSDGSNENPRTLVINADRSISAVFYPFVSLQINAIEGGSVNTEVNDSYLYGTSVEIIATPDEHYHFVKWSDEDTHATRTIVLTQDTILTAQFEIDKFTVTFKNWDGTVIESNEWAYGAIPSCSVVPTRPKEGRTSYIFDGWTPAIKAVDADAVYTATFVESVECYLTLTATVGGEVTLTGDYLNVSANVYTIAAGTQVQLRAIAESGYRFTGWSDAEMGNPRTLTINADLTLEAQFESAGTTPQYNIIITTGGTGNGTVDVASGMYYEGDVLTITATPAFGSAFTEWEDGSNANPRTYVVAGEATLQAKFDIKNVSLTISAGEGGSVNTEVNQIYPCGSSIEIIATPNEHYHFVKWSDEDTHATRTIVLTQDTILIAQFEIDKFMVTFKNWDGTVIESNEWAYGATPSCSVTPTRPKDGNTSYTFKGWTPAIVAVTADAIYTATYTEKQEAQTFYVTFFDWNNHVIDEQTVKEGEAATIPADPVREGYIFDHWEVEDGSLSELQSVHRHIDVWARYKLIEGLNDVEDGNRARKIYRNGQILILRNGKVYTLQGQQL